MEKITNTAELHAAILQLERKSFLQEQAMKERVRHITDSLRPINLLKNAARKVMDVSSLKNNWLKVAVGLGTGIIARKFVAKKVQHTGKSILFELAKFGIGSFIATKLAKKNNVKTGY